MTASRLKSEIAPRVSTHTNSLLGFLDDHQKPISRFILLDHMDWLYANYQEVLQAEWQSIVNRASDDAKILWRSAGLSVDFVDPLEVEVNGSTSKVGDLLEYEQDLANELHTRDRVHTYGSFYIANLKR